MINILLKMALQIILTAFREKNNGPVMQWPGRIVLPFSVLLSFPNHTLSDHYLNPNLMYECGICINKLSLVR